MNLKGIDTASISVVTNISARVGLLQLNQLSTAKSGGNNRFEIKQPYGAICLNGGKVSLSSTTNCPT